MRQAITHARHKVFKFIFAGRLRLAGFISHHKKVHLVFLERPEDFLRQIKRRGTPSKPK